MAIGATCDTSPRSPSDPGCSTPRSATRGWAPSSTAAAAIAPRCPSATAPITEPPDFSEAATPAALRDRHTTKPGVWALIHVTRGRLEYHVHGAQERVELLTPEAPGVVLPEIEHHVETPEPVSFYVEFWRASPEA